MAKSTKKSSFERDSKAVLETVLTSDAKARVHREMSLNKRQAAGDILPFPGDEEKQSQGVGQEKSTKPKGRKAAPSKGKLTLAELSKRLDRFIDETQRQEQERQAGARDMSGQLAAMHAALQDMEQTLRVALARSEEDRRELSTLGVSTADVQQQVDAIGHVLAEKPWDEAQASMGSMLHKLADRMQRLESGPPLPAVAQSFVPAIIEAGKTGLAKSALKDTSQSTPQEWLDKARAYWSGRRYSDPQAVMACLDKALALAPHDAQCLNERGLAKVDAGLLRQAAVDFSNALAQSPNMAAAYHNRGLVHMKLNLAEKACADFQRAAALGDDRAWRKARSSGYCGGSVFTKLLRGIID